MSEKFDASKPTARRPPGYVVVSPERCRRALSDSNIALAQDALVTAVVLARFVG
jgi:hypothetical protein